MLMETNMTFIDHLFFVVLVLVHPIVGYFSFKRLLRRIAAGEKVDRANLYSITMIGHWTLFCMAMAIWLAGDRDWGTLGFSLETGAWFVAAAVLTVIGIGFLLAQVRQVSSTDSAGLAVWRKALGKLEFIIPRNGNELGRFYGLSITAGIVEETLWRGYLIWYLAQFMPLWSAAVLSAVGFGLAHAYQGPANLPRITLVGAAFAGLYLLSGSLWLPMILHAAVDILQGRTAYEVIRKSGNGDAEPTGSDVPAESTS